MAGTALVGVSAQGDVGPSASSAQGRAAYFQHCASCHGSALTGGFGPPLIGAQFHQKWQGQLAKLTAYTKASMPPERPGALSDEAYEEIGKHILAINAANGDGQPPQDNFIRDTSLRERALLEHVRPVTDEMLKAPDDADWLHWRRTYSAQGFSPLAKINVGNVDKLVPAWSLTLSVGTNEVTPIVHDGVLFLDSAGVVQAIDIPTGDILWERDLNFEGVQRGIVSIKQPRNIAIGGNHLYVPVTDGARVVALNLRDGSIVWDHAVAPDRNFQLTGGPIVVRDKVIQGVAGCAHDRIPGGCMIVALDAATGKEAWRFNTLTRPGEKSGDTWNGASAGERYGGSVWVAGSYDLESDLLYFGVAQSYHIAPLLGPGTATSEKASALYTNSTLALDPDTGKLAWHYQHYARDVWDLDWAFERMLLTLPGEHGRMVVTIGKLGILDALDARTGRYLFSKDVGYQNLVTAIDPRTGTKIARTDVEPAGGKALPICPDALGVRNWPATSYDPSGGLLFIPIMRNCMNFRWHPGETPQFDRTTFGPDGSGQYGQIAALDLTTRKMAWSDLRRSPPSSAMLATAGGLIFSAWRDRFFEARESKTGKLLWRTRLNAAASSFPISFAANDQQYVAVVTGGGGPVDGFIRSLTPEIRHPPQSTTLWLFKLPDAKAQ